MAWVNWRQHVNDPVQVITENGAEVFQNLMEARAAYPDLNPAANGPRFFAAVHGSVDGRDAIRFDTHSVYEMLTR